MGRAVGHRSGGLADYVFRTRVLLHESGVGIGDLGFSGSKPF